MIPKKIPKIQAIAAISFMAFALSSCADTPARIIEDNRLLMGTVVQVKVSVLPGADEKKIRGAIDKAYDEIKRIEGVYSVYDQSSEISRINRLRKNEKLQISDGAFNLIGRALDCSEKTKGAFDITVKPLADLWHKAHMLNTAPDEYEVKRALRRVGYKDVVLDKVYRTITFKKEGMGLDLGGAAKGYATDRAITVLRDNGVTNALVTCGGDMYCLGKRSGGELWKVGIRHPRQKEKIFLELRLKDKAVSTSGDYERFFVLGGRRYSHIIDPRTGYPLGDETVSASVISPDSATSDMLATALSVLGDNGISLIDSFPGADAILVLKDKERFTVKMSEGAKKNYAVSKWSL